MAILTICCWHSISLFLLSAIPAAFAYSADFCYQPNRGSGCDYSEHYPCCPPNPILDQRSSGVFQDELIKQIVRLQPLKNDPGMSIGSPPFWDGALVLRMKIVGLFGIDQRSQTFRMRYRLKSSWRDCRTVHNCSFVSIDHKHPDFYKLWVPHFEIREMTNVERGMTHKMVVMDPDGYVQYESDHVGEFKCPFNFQDFPYDTQQCHLTFSIPQLPKVSLSWDITFGSGGIMHENSPDVGEWHIQDFQTSAHENKNFYTMKEGIRLSFKLARNSITQIRLNVMPTACFWFAGWCGLWLDCHAVPARAAMGIIPPLMMVSKMNALSMSLPASSTSNPVERYMLGVMFLLCLHLLEFAIVNFSMRREKERVIGKKEQEERVNGNKEKDTRDTEIGMESVKSANSENRSSVGNVKSIITVSEHVSHHFERLAIRYMNQNLNTHTRWLSALIFTVLTILMAIH